MTYRLTLSDGQVLGFPDLSSAFTKAAEFLGITTVEAHETGVWKEQNRQVVFIGGQEHNGFVIFEETGYQRTGREQRERQAARKDREDARLKIEAKRLRDREGARRRRAGRRTVGSDPLDHDHSMNA